MTILVALVVVTSGAQAAPSGWSRVDHDALRGGGHVVYINDIVAADGAGNPWLAVGYLVDSDGKREPSAWTSADGVTWRRSPMDSTGSSEQRDGPFFVARGGSTAVAVGNRFDRRPRTAAWWADGSNHWSALTDPKDQLLESSGHIEGLDAGPNGFVAVVYFHYSSHSVINVFRSEDGRAWHVEEAFASPGGEHFQPLEVSATSERIVVVGDTARGAGSDARIWVGEGGSWRRVDPASTGMDGPGLQQVSGIAWDPTLGYVAGGMTTRLNLEVPTLWISTDAVNWQRIELEGSTAAAIHRITAVPGGFLASGNSDSGPRIWRSGNARDWSPVATPSAPSEGGVIVTAASDGTKIVFLATGAGGSQMFYRSGAEWARGDTGPAFPRSMPFGSELKDVATARSRVVAVGNDGNGRPLVMYSSGGAGWRKAEFTDRAARLMAVTSDRGVFSIVGWRLVKDRAHLATWTSRTGSRWRLLGGTSNEPVGVFVDVAASSAGLVAAAFEGTSRGLVTTVWSRTHGAWHREASLGPGEARGVCAGPHGVTVVAVRGVGARARLLAWTRVGKGDWASEPELLAAGAAGDRCADGPKGTVIVGNDESGRATTWRRTRPGTQWSAAFLPSTAPATEILDVVRDGSGYLATGVTGGRGQSDLAVWRSPDGVQWTLLGGGEPAFVEPGFQAGLAIVPAPGRVIVTGRTGAGNAGLWVGPHQTGRRR